MSPSRRYDEFVAVESTLVPVEEYLRTTYKPACDYIDGVLRPKAMPTRKHGLIQARLTQLLNMGWPALEAVSEMSVRIREGKYLVPDVLVQRRTNIQDPYATEPVLACVEILSPDDRFSDVVAKCEDYLAWGAEGAWIIDPQTRQAWECQTGGRPHEVTDVLTVAEFSISISELFAPLD